MAAGRSRSLRLGESVGAVRFGRTEGAAVARSAMPTTPLYHYFNGSGFAEAFCRWEDDVRQIELFAEHLIPAFR